MGRSVHLRIVKIDYEVRDFVTGDAGGGFIHRTKFRRGAVVNSKRAEVEVVMSPFVRDDVDHPAQVGGFHHHGGIDANAAYADDERGYIEGVGNVIFDVDLIVEGKCGD